MSQNDVQNLDIELGPRWKLTREEDYVTRRHFNWQDMDNYHRYEFTRAAPVPKPASQPAAAPVAVPGG
jgi:hypothetical protein